MKYLLLLFFLVVAVHARPVFAQTVPLTRGFGDQTPGITVTSGDQKFEIPGSVVASWEKPTKLSNHQTLISQPQSPELLIANSAASPKSPTYTSQDFDFNPTAIYQYLQTIADTLNKPAVEPNITITNNRVTNFSEPQDGQQLDQYKSTFLILSALANNNSQVPLEVSVTKPQQSLAALNNLGINDLLARGESNFKGSPNNRRHNIVVGVEKMKGVLVPPGKEFSFNDNLGPVDGEHGFLPELVIKGNNTIPEFGGGLCQVSSTTFRAAMQAGVPITQRRNHAYAVQYYAPQGTDATIYPGVIDLKFVNDTPGYILIWPYFKDKDNLAFDFYGTKDDRQVTVEKPQQYDRQSNGALKASWQREVVKDGQSRTDVFKSTYQPPALFHHENEFAGSTTTPSSGLPMPKLN